MTLGIVLSISAVLYIWCEPLGRLILNAEDGHIVVITGRLMRLMAPLYFLYVFGEIYGGALRGAGESFAPMLITLLGTCKNQERKIGIFHWLNLIGDYAPGNNCQKGC